MNGQLSRVMSLTPFATDNGRKFNGDKERFGQAHQKIGSTMKAMGVHCNLALMRQGEFKNHVCDENHVAQTAPRLDSAGLVRPTAVIDATC